MIGLSFLLLTTVLVSKALSDGPTSKPSGATSYSVYHRKFEPKDGPSKSVHYSTKITPKFSASSYSKDERNSNLNKGPSFSKDNFADGPSPTLSERSPTSKLSSSYSDDGPNYQKSNSDVAEYSNSGPSNSESNGQNNYSGEERNFNDGTNYDAPNSPAPVTQYTNEGTNYSPPSYPSETPVFNDVPSYVPPPSDLAYNPGPPSYITPGPVQVPSYDNSPFIPSPSFNHGFHQYPVNAPQFSSQYNPGSHSHFPVNVPKASYSISGLPSSGQFSYQPNQFNFNPIASAGHHHHFSSPIKGFPQVSYQQPLVLGSSRVPVVYKPSYDLHGGANSASTYHSQFR